MSKLNSIESNPERKLAIRINVVQSGCNRSVSNNVVSFSRNVVLSDPLFSIKVVSKTADVVGSSRLCSQFATR
jgi:hypothetical protein